MPAYRLGQTHSRGIHRIIPRYRLETSSVTSGTHTPQWRRQPVWMVHPLVVPRNFGTNDASVIITARRAIDTLDGVVIDPLDFNRTLAWAIVRADRMQPFRTNVS